MENQLKQDFTRRISQANRSELHVIMYEIFFAYASEAKGYFEKKETEKFKDAIRHATKVVNGLDHNLDPNYPLYGNLASLYQYCKIQLSNAISKEEIAGLLETEKVLKHLFESIKEIAKKDTSGPMMQNTQPVYAGMTYGRMDLTENYKELDSQRGFFV